MKYAITMVNMFSNINNNGTIDRSVLPQDLNKMNPQATVDDQSIYILWSLY